MAKYKVEVGGFVNTYLKSIDGFDSRFRCRKQNRLAEVIET